MQSRHPHFLQRLVPIALGVAVANGVSAAQWTTSAGVAPAIEYTDNVCLSSDNEKDEWIGLVTPDVGIAGSGRRANVSLSASVELNTLTDSDLEDRGCSGGRGFGDRNQYAPDVNANADAILVEDWLFIDADATADQNDVSSFASGGNDSLDRNGNTNTTYRYSVSPYIQRRFKNTADLTLRYTYDDQYNSKDLVGDSSEQSAAAILAGGPVFSPISWSLQGNYSKVDYSNTDRPGQELNNDTELKSAQFNLGYQINRAWQINGYYGREWNDFVSSRDDIDGDFWDVGFRWTPTPRTTVEAGTGDRFFGSTPRFSINHRHKRSVLTASYEKELTYNRDIRTLDGGGNATTLTNSPLLDERFTLGYAYTGRRSSLGINGSYSEQTRAEGGGGGDEQDLIIQEGTFKDVSVSVSRTLARNLSISGGVSWEDSSPKGSRNDIVSGFVDDAETWRVNLGAQRQLNQNMSLSFDYQYTDRQSDTNAQSGSLFDEYTENRFTLTLRINLL